MAAAFVNSKSNSATVPALFALSPCAALSASSSSSRPKFAARNTRKVYARAVQSFFTWCEAHGLHNIAYIEPVHAARYVEDQQRSLLAPSLRFSSGRSGGCQLAGRGPGRANQSAAAMRGPEALECRFFFAIGAEAIGGESPRLSNARASLLPRQALSPSRR